MIGVSGHCVSQAVAFNPVLANQGVKYLADGKVEICLKIPRNAQQVSLRLLDGKRFELSGQGNEIWSGRFDPGFGFHYADVLVDETEVLSPYLPIGFGCSRPINFIDVPIPGEDGFYQPDDGPHGSVIRHYFPSSVTEELESCLVYQPPQYDPSQAYPVLYLQHGLGENETGWVHQGRANFILDRQIHQGAATPMLVVMCSGMVQIHGVYNNEIFPQLLVNDVIPFIEGAYQVKKDKWHRAMAGLSMGSMHTSIATLSHPELFGYAGIFSGFLHHLWKEEQPHLDALNDADAFKKNYRIFFRAMGREDSFFSHFQQDDALLAQKGIQTMRRLYDGDHGWQVWRQCLRDFLPLIFKEATI